MGTTSIMEWSATSATKAYLDTIKLCSNDIRKRRRDQAAAKTQEPGSSEFVSALAAGMSAKLIVEVTPAASPSTIALAAAARHTGGKLVCILPEPDELAESKRVIRDSGLKDLVEFETGDPTELLLRHSNVDFSLVNCAGGRDKASCVRLLGSIDVNPTRSVVVAKNFSAGGGESKPGLGLGLGLWSGLTHFRRVLDKKKVVVRSVKQYPIGKGIEVITMTGKRDRGGGGGGAGSGGGGVCTPSFGVRKENNNCRSISSSSSSSFVKKSRASQKSKWVVEFDEESGEEHIFRLPKK